MKVLLQNKKTRLFLKEPGAWTQDINDAFEFINHAITQGGLADRLGL